MKRTMYAAALVTIAALTAQAQAEDDMMKGGSMGGSGSMGGMDHGGMSGSGSGTMSGSGSGSMSGQGGMRGMEHGGMQMEAMADGEVRKVDRETGKITLRHGPIASLDMPAMTMVYGVKDRSALEHLSVGDKVKFAAEKTDAGYSVTKIERAK